MSSVTRICSIEGCDKVCIARGLCPTHYAQWRRTNDPKLSEATLRKRCCVGECDRPDIANGLCSKHYQRLINHGDINYVRPHVEKDRQCSIESCDNRAKVGTLCHKHYWRKHKYGSPTYPVEKREKIHGMQKSLEYSSWITMKQRCYNPNNQKYSGYGARGIKVCKRWRVSFLAFLEDMGRKTKEAPSIDRINNDGHYSCGKCEECVINGWKANCKWATPKEQVINRRKNKNNTTGYRGVYPSRDKWYAVIINNYRQHYLGRFATIEEAALAYDRAAIKYFGERAQLNIL